MIETEVCLRSVDDSLYIQGYGSLFNQVYYVPQDGWFERIEPNAFTRSISEGKNINVCYNHDLNSILGNTETGTAKVWVDDKGLNYRVKFDPQDPDHQKVRSKIDKGIIKGSSMQFFPTKMKFLQDAKYRHIAVVEDCTLCEVGPVNTPVNANAPASVRSVIQDQYQDWLKTINKIEEWKERTKK